METHPVPQNISSYEFRLVGDMTLKQFLQLAGGIVLAVIIFRTPLIGILKYPLVFISAMGGIALAFIPINNRPFSAWFSAFLKAIYSPTEYVWSPKPVVKPLPVSPPTTNNQQPTTNIAPASFVPPTPLPITQNPSPITNSAPTTTSYSQITDVPKTITNNSQLTTHNLQSVTNDQQPMTNVLPASRQDPSPLLAVAPAQAGITNFSPLPPSTVIKSMSTAPAAPPAPTMASPTTPNVVAGIVTDSQNQPLPSVTVEIVDTATSLPIRALRTNKLGQFQIAIPLPDGQYNLLVDKDNYVFAPASVQAAGRTIPPIVISGSVKPS